MGKKLKIMLVLIGFVMVLAGINWVYQVVHNPVILLNPFIGDDYKSFRSTWKAYRHLFERHATPIMTAEYLGALAQVESAGNPLITPEWRWRLTTDFFKIYAPASTSAGLYQYTKPTFQDAKRFCIHNHKVALKGPFFKLNSCWFNGFYSRLWPSHAIEMTSARLHYYVEQILSEQGKKGIEVETKQKLASIIHLCGVGKGKRFVQREFRFSSVPTCGTHNTLKYYNRIRSVKKRYQTSGNIFL
ncbi:lytic transglycosylase domain-containing protein [bacterium]|nr:lytic transglycosylase domain-containing protein [bacterium]